MDSSFTFVLNFKKVLYILLICILPFYSFSNTDIIGDVWVEAGFDGMYDGTGGISGVTVELLDNESLIIVATTITTNGKFEFLGVDPGKYIIQIPASQFVTGASLVNLISCPGITPADDMIDDNDNGSDSAPMSVRTTSFALTDNSPTSNALVDYIDFCFFENLCDQENAFASNTCAEIMNADIICDINTLSSFCSTMPVQNFSGDQPNPLCSGSSNEIENISWFSFVAYDGAYSISINPITCTSGLGVSGLEVGVFEDCSFTEPIFCNTDCTNSSVEIPSSIFTPGQVYYLFIDGCNGSVCTYDIDIMGLPQEPSLMPDAVCVNNNGIIECDSTEYCIGGDIVIEATGLNIVASYNWQITTLSGGPYLPTTNPISSSEELQIEFSNAGDYEVCIINIDNGCQNWSGNICTKINVSNTIPFVGDEVFSNQFVCIGEEENYDLAYLDNQDPNNDGISGWQGPMDNISLGTNTTLILTSGCAYNQSFELDTYEEAPVSNVFLSICGQDLPMQYENITLTEDLFDTEGIVMIDSIIAISPNQNGCDSIINLAIEKLDIVDGVMNSPECTFNSIILDFDYDDQESTNFIFLDFTWTDPFGNVIFDSDNDLSNIEITNDNPSGIYTLTVTIVKNGFSCDYIYPVMVDFADITPPAPSVSGITVICGGSNSEAIYTAVGGDASFNYLWTVPSDVIDFSISGPLGSILTVSWAGSEGGSITLQSENECGFSEVVTLDVTVLPTTTPQFNLDNEVCINGQTSVSSIGPDINVISYLWSFGSAQVISGGTSNLGPNVLSWSTDGPKLVSLRTTNTNGCVSETVSDTIEVLQPMDPVQIICQTTINDILFQWTPQDGVEYSALIPSGQNGAFEGNSSYRVTGLTGGESVTLELIQTPTIGVCTDPITTTTTCTAQDCPVISVILSSGQTSFCENENEEAQINVIVTSDVNGAGTFSGPGIVNNQGLFDPTEANIGTNTITYTYTDVNGCLGFGTIDFEVKEAPISDISASQMAVCLGGTLQLNYSGNSDVDSYNWQNDELTIAAVANPTLTFETVGTKTITLEVTKDGCVSNLSSIDIIVENLPEATFTVDSDTICLSQEIQLTYTGVGDADDFNWDVGIGNVDNIPNPTVGFIFPGEKTIELIVSIGDCVSDPFTKNIFVEDPLAPPSISCEASLGQIEFTWNPVVGASSYNVSINGGSPFVSTLTSAIVDNLESGEEVDIVVVAISDSSCPNVTSSLFCESLINSSSETDVSAALLYPNPANSTLFIDEFGDMKNYTIMDINGRIVLQGTYNSGIDIQSLAGTLYVLRLTDNSKKKTQIMRFIKS